MNLPDVTVENHGTIFLLRPVSDAAVEWIKEHTPDATMWGTSLVVEHRFVVDIVERMREDGLVVE